MHNQHQSATDHFHFAHACAAATDASAAARDSAIGLPLRLPAGGGFGLPPAGTPPGGAAWAAALHGRGPSAQWPTLPQIHALAGSAPGYTVHAPSRGLPAGYPLLSFPYRAPAAGYGMPPAPWPTSSRFYTGGLPINWPSMADDGSTAQVHSSAAHWRHANLIVVGMPPLTLGILIVAQHSSSCNP